MNSGQNAFFQMLAAVRVTVDSFEAAWHAKPSFADPYGLLRSEVLDRLPAALAQQGQTSTGVTADKGTVRATLEAQLVHLAGSIEAYAATTSNRTLRADAHLTASDATHFSDETLVGAATRIAELAAGHRSNLTPYGVTAAAIASLRTAAAAYTGWIGKPRAVNVAKRSGTEALEGLLVRARTLLDTMDAQLVLFQATAPDFCSQYVAARKIVSAGSRRRAISFAVTDATGKPVENVAIDVPALALAKRTGVSGACYVQNAPAGLYVGTATKQGFHAQDLRISVNDGETAQVTVVLTPMA